MSVSFSEIAWNEYLQWQQEDKKTLKRINALIKSIQNDGLLKGIGKPEKLKYCNDYSRRIDDKNRLLYNGSIDSIIITSCKGHYDDK